ncbi:tetratricopeptide repeat protein [uncultured Aquimarina sp.]|uniref:tetratricopeptide repeat protein n=1 Tax=uncultured Aquimarina sp. TaxID=575652 RepID=UPI00262E331F|nr:tetratricopeptide repeat protein [uncultured Aquimarina sp.]
MNTIEQDIEKYLNGEMTKEETTVFLKKIDVDPDAKRMLELYQEMDTVYDEKNWELIDRNTRYKKVEHYESFLKSDSGKTVSEAILKAEQSYFEEPHPSKIKQIFLYAGAIAAVFVAGLFLVNQFNKNVNGDQLYAEYKNWDVLPSLTLRDGGDDLTNIEKLFRDKRYEESLALLQKYVSEKDKEVNPQLLLYIGVTQLELNQNEAAIGSFTKLLNSNTLDVPKAHWYLALCYLKLNDLEKAKSELNLLVRSNISFQKNKAKELLEKLDE